MSKSPKILKTMGAIEGEGQTQLFDTIEHQGEFWLVPTWLDQVGQGVSKPARIIRLVLLGATKSTFPNFQFLLPLPVPKELFDPEISPQIAKRYGVVDLPNILVPRTH